MVEKRREGVDRENGARTAVVRETVSRDPEEAVTDLLEIVAELQGVAVRDLPSFYDATDHVVESVLSTPPSTRAQMQLEFSYAGYRITLTQDGTVELVAVNPEVD